jgi:Tfp pilus assembly protein PilN
MKDLNFFINPNARKGQSHLARNLLIIAAVLVVAIGGLFWLMNDRNNKVQAEIDALQAKLTSAEIVEGHKAYLLARQQLNLLTQYDQGLTAIDTALASQDRIKRDGLDKIAAAIPKEITLTALTFTTTDMVLSAVSDDLTANAELVRNLKDTGLFATVELLTAAKPDEEGTGDEDRILTIQATLTEVIAE